MRSPVDPSLEKGVVLNGRRGTRWRVVDTIGVGGTAVVYAVEDSRGAEAAAKMLSGHRFPVTDAMRSRFAREIAHLSSIDHPDVVCVFDRATHQGADVLICERVAGSLYESLRTVGRPPLPQALAWLCSALAGTQALHDLDLVHRDLSPKNLLVRADGTLLVADFGTVRHHDDATVTLGEGLGSLIYISPQQFEAPHEARQADDVYALGQIAWELLTGRRPHGNTPRADELADVPDGLARLVEAMRHYDLPRRPSALQALIVLLGGDILEQAPAAVQAGLRRLSACSLSAIAARLRTLGDAGQSDTKAVDRAIAECASAEAFITGSLPRRSDGSRDRYRYFQDRAREGRGDDVDFLMAQLMDDHLGTLKLVDFALGSVRTPVGVARIDHYLFEGTRRQRNYAALYFKRRGDVARLARAVAAGAVDETQARSR